VRACNLKAAQQNLYQQTKRRVLAAVAIVIAAFVLLATLPFTAFASTNDRGFATGWQHTIAVNHGGRLYTWGDNSNGQLGTGNTKSSDRPVRMGSESNWSAVSAGMFSSYAINTKGELWAWGNNQAGQLGINSFVDKKLPTQVAPQVKWADVNSGSYHVLALTQDGDLYAWGSNKVGQLGTGTTMHELTPKRINIDRKWFAICAGTDHSFAITTTGELWAWGNNREGQLGDGSNADQYLPKQIGTASNWRTLCTGMYHTLATNAEGELYAWGHNNWGQLGVGGSIVEEKDGANKVSGYRVANTVNYNSPQLVTTAGADTDWAFVCAGNYHSMAIDSAGKMYGWGFNGYGQLGTGNKIPATTPTAIDSKLSWSQICASEDHTLAIDSEGHLWAWGWNSKGQLGDGTLVDRATPTLVSFDSAWGGTIFYIVSFNSLGGTSFNDLSIAEGNSMGINPIPVKPGYKFDGWYTAENGGSLVNATTSIKSRLTLYARWSPGLGDPTPAAVAITNQQASTPILEGGQRSLGALITPANAANKQVNWTSSNSQVASVDTRGIVTAHKSGEVNITAKAKASPVSATVTLKVQGAPTALVTPAKAIAMSQRTSAKIPLVVKGKDNSTVPLTWSASNPKVASIESGGASGSFSVAQNATKLLTVKAGVPGTSRITIRTANNKTLVLTITVSKTATKLNKLAIAGLPSKATLSRGKTVQLRPKTTPAKITMSGQAKWTSSKPAVASVDQLGQVKAVAKGTTVITLRVASKSAKINLTVR